MNTIYGKCTCPRCGAIMSSSLIEHEEHEKFCKPIERMTGIQMIANERQEQICKHGFTKDKDDVYIHKELAQAAIYCIRRDGEWPFREPFGEMYREKIADKSYKDRLVIAGALIAAEIDRVNVNI